MPSATDAAEVVDNAKGQESLVASEASQLEQSKLERSRYVFQEAPKVELHTHLDGSLQPQTLCELAMCSNNASKMLTQTFLNQPPPHGCRLSGAMNHLQIMQAKSHFVLEETGKMKANNVTDRIQACSELIAPFVTSFRSRSLTEFLQPFSCVSAFISLPDGIELMSRNFVAQQAAENVIYSEAQFAPQLLLTTCNPFVDCKLDSQVMLQELKNVTRRTIYGIASSRDVEAEKVVVRVLVDCFRGLPVSFCEQILELVIEMKKSNDVAKTKQGKEFRYADFIVGVNLAGDEIKFPNFAKPGETESFAELFGRMAPRLRLAGLGFSPHSGEPDVPQAVQDCDLAFGEMGAQRIGHGYYCSEARLSLVAKEKQHIEVCPASSVATGAVADWNTHPIRKMLQLGVSISLNTDDRAIIGTTMTEQHVLARFELDFSLRDLIRVAIDGIGASFGSAKEDMCKRIRTWWQENIISDRIRAIANASEIHVATAYLDSLNCSSQRLLVQQNYP